jgi:hypothetical protein
MFAKTALIFEMRTPKYRSPTKSFLHSDETVVLFYKGKTQKFEPSAYRPPALPLGNSFLDERDADNLKRQINRFRHNLLSLEKIRCRTRDCRNSVAARFPFQPDA